MKSLQEREADRKRRAEEAEAQKKESAKILASGTVAANADSEEEEEQEGYDALTVKELKAELDGRGIEYTSDAKKADLVDLLEQDDNDAG